MYKSWIGKSEAGRHDYKLELKISVCMLVNVEFRILTEFQISNFNFEFCNLTSYDY